MTVRSPASYEYTMVEKCPTKKVGTVYFVSVCVTMLCALFLSNMLSWSAIAVTVQNWLGFMIW